MPESKSRKKKVAAPAPQAADKAAKAAKARTGNPAWLVPLMLTLMVLGLVWIVVFYITNNRAGGGFPIPALHQWNLAIGFALVIAGFGLTTQWK
ncbi:cell division protein CrgA [Xylanimonas allomyrinae]|uniref:Cell division protein CrgA n=1 Tax=Xylanimonas allomyrinae TaxID=2509459 RepID=A0A4P6ENK6_9MICO|nr:cell division protein CrgA [Xylanimonas allomyrinae]QAY64006.1 cell division protein CrgA [Xylanimonas allomyrinae]